LEQRLSIQEENNMSVKAISRILQVMDQVTHRQIDNLVEHCEDTEKVLTILEDEDSRNQYWRELVFNRLYFLLKDEEEVNRWAGNIKSQEWDAILAETRRMRDAGQFPALECPASPEWLAQFMFASIFLLRQYWHPQVEIPKGGVFLDCGAGFGETTVWAVLNGAGKVYAFEPNEDVVPILERNIASFAEGRAEILRLALGHESGKLAVEVRDPPAVGTATPRQDTEESIRMVTLDEWAQERSVVPDFIKMDVDGFETKAILGGQKTIMTHRPRLAIAIYHDLPDYWNIPLLLKRMVPEYRFWCRKSSKFTAFILYAAV
jgi:FkbM family methyltransferase